MLQRTRMPLSRTLAATSVTALLTGLLLALPGSSAGAASGGEVRAWLTTADRTNLLARQPDPALENGPATGQRVITVEPGRTFQTMEGFGASLTDSSAWLIANSPRKDEIMSKLFHPGEGIGLSFLRQPMGASDFARSVYTYHDLPAGHSDPTLTRFSIARDQVEILPLLRQALQLNPAITVMGSPWTAPSWMKTSESHIGGRLKESAYQSYADYFVKFVQAYEQAGVPVALVTPQNEPEYSPGNYPGMLMPVEEQARFIATALGPKLAQAGLKTRIIGYDHNWDNTNYPDRLLRDPAAAKYTAGTAFHCYGGDSSAQSTVHDAHPAKDIYFTECSGIKSPDHSNTFRDTLAWHARNLVIGATRNWAKSVVLWNLALDPEGGPSMNCRTCTGMVTVNDKDGTAEYNAEYYSLGHIAKFVRPGATRIGSNSFGKGDVENVAFRNTDGSIALVVHNGATEARAFQVNTANRRSFRHTLPAGSVATFTWTPEPGGPEPKPLDRSDWLASSNSVPTDPCCVGDLPARAIDGDPGTRWTTGAAQRTGQWFQLDLGAAKRFTRLVLESAGGDHPRSFTVHASVQRPQDGCSLGELVAEGTGTGSVTTVELLPSTARYVRITQTGGSGNWWSLNEVNLFG